MFALKKIKIYMYIIIYIWVLKGTFYHKINDTFLAILLL